MGKTKAEGYEALRKIEEILEGFDPEETYIGKAFEGCVEQAKQNIDNDWLYSWKGRYLDEQAKNCKLSDKLSASEEHRVELTNTLNQKDDAIARLEDARKLLSKEIVQLYGTLDYKDETCKDLEDKLEEEHQKLEKSQAEIIRLKAKLYDMMTAGEELEE